MESKETLIPLKTGKACSETNIRSTLDPLLEHTIPAAYYIEISSDCNLKCALCPFSHREIFERKRGKMDYDLFCKILDKIKVESPNTTISPYHFCEPCLHPLLPEMIKAIKDRGFRASASFNFCHIPRLDEILNAGLDEIIVSVSGSTQSTYEKGHAGGDIEKVKQNLLILHETIKKQGLSPLIAVSYHMYRDNLGLEFDEMKKIALGLGFTFMPIWARSISVELTLKWLRENGLNTYKGPSDAWFDALAPLNASFTSTVKERLLYTPLDFLEHNKQMQKQSRCIYDNKFIHIKWDGRLNLCICAFDDRLTLGDYLTTSLEEFYVARAKHLLCKECLENKIPWSFSYLDIDGINTVARAKYGRALPDDRHM